MLLLFSLHVNPAILPHFFPKCTSSRICILIRCHKPLFCARLSHGFPHFAQSGNIRCAFPVIVSAVCIHNSCRPLFQQCCDSFYRTVPNMRVHLHHRLPLKKQLAKQVIFIIVLLVLLSPGLCSLRPLSLYPGLFRFTIRILTEVCRKEMSC